ncbi:MAG: hypothetical protein LHW48_09435 [Candidatus Cloacimonetes bacterium]|nr:hypothetical protein [Candidatus Cloacimonadota bacterium]MDD4686818.1 hypothetical protein [Candidatus Cloacimonadota bacterium]
MKQIALVIAMLAIIVTGYAQEAKQEAIMSIDEAKVMLSNNQLLQAQEELNYAQSKISELLSEELVKFIPDAPDGFTLNDRSAQSLGQAGAIIGSANSVAASGTYSKEDVELELSIVVGGLIGQSGGLAGLANLFGGMASTNTKKVRINGYNATSEYDSDNQSGTLTIKVGGKITVIVEGEYLEDVNILKTLAEQVDLAGLEEAF